MRTEVPKPKTSYWWDIEGSTVIVESTDPHQKVAATFPFDPKGGAEAVGEMREFCVAFGLPTKVGAAADAIRQAEAFIYSKMLREKRGLDDLGSGTEVPTPRPNPRSD